MPIESNQFVCSGARTSVSSLMSASDGQFYKPKGTSFQTDSDAKLDNQMVLFNMWRHFTVIDVSVLIQELRNWTEPSSKAIDLLYPEFVRSNKLP